MLNLSIPGAEQRVVTALIVCSSWRRLLKLEIYFFRNELSLETNLVFPADIQIF